MRCGGAPDPACSDGHVFDDEAFHSVIAAADTIRSRRTGEIIGYDSTTGSFSRKTGMVHLQVAAAVKGGILVGRLRADFSTGADVVVFQGSILKGTGKFKGVEGTITANPRTAATRPS